MQKFFISFFFLGSLSSLYFGQVHAQLKVQVTYPLIKQAQVKAGEGLFQALRRVSIEGKEALDIINLLRDEVEFSKLKVGDQLQAHFSSENQLEKFSFAQNIFQTHHVVSKTNESGQTNWEYQFEEQRTVWQPRLLEGELKKESTLHEDLFHHQLSSQTVNEIVNVLLCKVNFRFNARAGDKFKVLLSERKYHGITVESKVLYTSYDGKKAGRHEAFFYEDEEKSSTYTAHYTKDGEALIRSGLRYPLSSLHIRSGFGWRRHPVTGRRAMHFGVDLRARSGHKVHAVADGKVVISNFDKYAGNRVAIRHRDGSSSHYYHLASRGVNVGDYVKSYQVIGSVGATGRVTGAHLHFGFKKANGRWMNPLNKRMIATPKLNGERFHRLSQQVADTSSLLIDLEVSQNAKYLVANYPGYRSMPYPSLFLFD